MFSEAFYISAIGISTAFLTGICLAALKIVYKVKCSDFSCMGISCTRDTDAENEADYNNPNTDSIPPPSPSSR